MEFLRSFVDRTDRIDFGVFHGGNTADERNNNSIKGDDGVFSSEWVDVLLPKPNNKEAGHPYLVRKKNRIAETAGPVTLPKTAPR